MTDTHPQTVEAALRHHLAQIADRLAARDLAGVGELYASGIVSFDVQPPLQHVGRAAKLTNWEQVFAVFEKVEYEVADLAFTVGEEVAFGHGFGRIGGVLKDGTATSGMWVRATFCFQRIDGDWLIVHDHASVPFDLLTGRGVTDLEP